ncbi:5-dehydro-2-deoxygluconokinase [Clostridium sp. AN503]|uniref:5-dehydro-2-deoxygluconokinase n=1 Tax=Clostridium sp. AN503 TaxID=3160598 RepID=UPI0034592553
MRYVEFGEDKKYDLILLGRVAIDFNPVDYYKTLAESGTFKKYVGGSPANIAVGLSRLGKKCGFFARVSDDRFGEFVTDFFEEEGIDTSHIRTCENGESLGLTFTEILSHDESSILMYRNGIADLALCPEDIDEDYLAQAKAVLISGTALAASPSREAALKAVALAKKNGVRVIFDIDYRAYNWKSEDEIAVYYAAVARDSDIILGSREEYDLTERFLGLDGTDEASARYWCRGQASIVVIKHGKEGSTAYTKDGRSYSIRPFPVNALKGFGGGDGYASSFLFGILNGYEMMDCLELGSASASMLVASHGCSPDMPTESELKEFIRKEKEQFGEMVARVE